MKFYFIKTKSTPYVPCGHGCQSVPRPPFIDDTCTGKLNLAGRYLTPLTLLPSTLNEAVGNKRAKTVLVPIPLFIRFVSSFRTNN